MAMRGFLPRFNMQLKAWGILVPGSDFHHLSRLAYAPDSQGWIDVQQFLLEMRDTCTAHDATLAVYVLPQFTALRRDLLSMPRRAVREYLDEIGVPNDFGFEHFRGRSWEEVAVSPFDYHPNVQANSEIADIVYDWLYENAAPAASQPPG